MKTIVHPLSDAKKRMLDEQFARYQQRAAGIGFGRGLKAGRKQGLLVGLALGSVCGTLVAAFIFAVLG